MEEGIKYAINIRSSEQASQRVARPSRLLVGAPASLARMCEFTFEFDSQTALSREEERAGYPEPEAPLQREEDAENALGLKENAKEASRVQAGVF